MSKVTFPERWYRQVQQNSRIDDFSALLAEEFALQTVPSSRLDSLRLPEQTKTFLADIGLPRSAAPFLNLYREPDLLRRIPEVWGHPETWTPQEVARLEPYLLLYGDGEGNPLCLDTAAEGAVVALDHEVNFTNVRFVNTGVEEFAEMLLAYMTLLQGEHPDRAPEEIDAAAVKEGTFWHEEFSLLAGNGG